MPLTFSPLSRSHTLLSMLGTTQIIGNTHIRLPAIGSTNAYALELISKSKPVEGTLISTVDQTAGKGQAENVWESESGKNFTGSVILYPIFLHPREQFRLNQAISLAVWDTVHDLVGEEAKIKWPNDIYVGNRKICGLLIQNSITSQKIQSSVIGIGLNVNQTDFSTKIPNATSVKKEVGEERDLQKVIDLLCAKIGQYYLQLRTRNFDLINQAYLRRLYQFEAEAFYQNTADGSVFSGKIIGTTSHGKLKIDTQTGERVFDLKEVKFL